MKIYGQHDARTIQQLERCVAAEDNAVGILCADGHLGYSMPIGGVVGYRKYVQSVWRELRHRLREPRREDSAESRRLDSCELRTPGR